MIGTLNELFELFSEGERGEKVSVLLKKLLEDSEKHFTTEEGYFKKYNYPDYQAHKDEHSKFIQAVTEFVSKYEHKQLTVTLDVIKFLENWLKDHIMGSDKKYHDFLKELDI